MDGKKADLHARYEGFQSRGFQVKSETMKNLTDSKSRNLLSVNGLRVDLMNKMTGDKALSNKVDKLVNDYNALFGGG